MKQTAVEWLKNEMAIKVLRSGRLSKSVLDLFQQALEIEKQQKEKMYSEEEILDLLAKFRRENRYKDFIPFKDIQEWFEQFKK
jgi:hypothetical protein